ncbi:MAG TPA: polyribonucleotide nucleotidyltransferase [Candidatus Hydrogenedentes bacterium]|nr:polyribonucleotide nucleotidyltransferase [Candidatus Hydrogenedentota bacterium]
MTERLSVQIGDAELSFETGKIARQAHGAVMVTQGETMVLSTTVVAPEAKPGQGFFPLTVDYREKSSSAGRIPGNFFRREGRPTEREVLICRLTDRPLRPLFPKGFVNEVQVFSTVFSADNENDPDVMSINGASAALHISQIPFNGPVGAVRVGMIDGQLVVNPGISQRPDSQLDVVIAGSKDAIMMVEGRAQELSEEVMLQALEFGHKHIKDICACIEALRAKVGVEKMTFAPPAIDPAVVADVEALAKDRLRQALGIAEKITRYETIGNLRKEVETTLLARYGEEAVADRASEINEAYDNLEKKTMREQVVKEGRRIDGRDHDTVRPITIEVGFLPRVHGSCLFTRGETQAIVTTTLGTSRDEQRLDELTGEEFRRFMLHYNFPSWSVGEVRPVRGPGRREIGHGKLAERAIEAVLPFSTATDGTDDDNNFPYTVRVLSDITESNGSSSMATVCGGILSLMDAGVPIKAPVAGIAMGLIKEGDDACVLTDIMGAEDHLGDMDFKVCGTAHGITAFQMDIKIQGITSELMKKALDKARTARLHVLDKMIEALEKPRADISPYAPRIYTIKIDVDKIREVIGPGGKVIREIQAQSGAEIEIEDDGTINVAAVNQENAEKAIDLIRSIVAVPEVGQIYKGAVTRIMNFGAFVSLVGSKEGLVHISQLAPYRVNEVTDVVNVGDEVQVKVVEIDKMGRINLSKVEAERDLGLLSEEDMARMDEAASQGGHGGSPRGHDRGRGGDRGGDRGGRPPRHGGGRDRR